jgi:hypothetical protein
MYCESFTFMHSYGVASPCPFSITLFGDDILCISPPRHPMFARGWLIRAVIGLI